jgi:hypothetical protein
MNELKVERVNMNLLRIVLFFIFFILELYLYVFVRNDNILDLFVTIATGIGFIISLVIYFKYSKEKKLE